MSPRANEEFKKFIDKLRDVPGPDLIDNYSVWLMRESFQAGIDFGSACSKALET